MLDVMTANRDECIWARATGKDKRVDDSNVPAPIPVISNVGGKSKNSSAQKEGVLRYISGEEGIKHMAVATGFKVNLFADEAKFPQLVKPGKADDVGNKAIALSANGFDTGFIPESNDILRHTKLLDSGKEEVVDFTAPASPGDYPYACSFPGHHLIMRGMLHVK